MSSVTTVGSSALGTSLSSLLLCEEIQPGSEPSYQICKVIYTYHPLGAKMAESPIKMAQFLPREITVQDGPAEDLQKAFNKQWKDDRCDFTIRNVATLSRVYGIASLSCLTEGDKPDTPLDVNKLSEVSIAYNVLDPLNTAGSLVLNQDPNAFDFQKYSDIAVNGVRYHRSRTVTLMHEQPIYIEYTSSAFGFVGRSVYQRALFPLKSFVQTMIADDMVSRKVGLIVASLKMAGSIVDAVMSYAAGVKRAILQIGATNNVISIAEGETISSLDLTNLDGPLDAARKHIVENVAASGDMPAVVLNHESFAEGFGEGTEDAKKVAEFVDGIRSWMEPLYNFMDMTTQRRAWNEKFFETIKVKFPERYKNKTYEQAFYEWTNSFSASWPSLLREPESELVRVADTKLKAAIAATQVIIPEVDPINKGLVLQWLVDQFNGTEKLFKTALDLDFEALEVHLEEQKNVANQGEDDEGLKEPKPNKPFAASDSNALAAYLGNNSENSDLHSRILSIEDHLKRVRK